MSFDSTEPQESVQIPEDFEAFETWRRAGDEPEPEPETPSATAEEAVKTDAPDSDPEETEQEQEETEQPGQKGRGFQRRIDKLTAKIRELESRLAPANETTGVANPKPSQVTAQEGKPSADSFDSYDEYIEALTDWRLEQRERQKLAAEKVKAVAETWQSRVEAVKAKAEYADFQEVMDSADIPVSAAIHEALITDENGPQVAYYLAQHREEAERIAKLSDVGAARELGKLSARFAQAPETKKPQVTKAPKPPTPIGGKAAKPTPDINDEEYASDFARWERSRKAQIRGRLAA